MRPKYFLILLVASIILLFPHKVFSQYITNIAGAGTLSSNVPAVSSPMYAFQGSVDASGNIYFFEYQYYNVLRKMDTNGMIHTVTFTPPDPYSPPDYSYVTFVDTA